jgi:Firmicute plasmid replication protein (RepL).
MPKIKDSITFIQTKQTIDYSSGEVVIEENVTNRKRSIEPPFVKLYLDCLLTYKDLSKSLNPILAEFLKYMSYANVTDNQGGQIIYLNAEMKRQIAKATGKTVKRIEQALTDFVKSGVFRRVATSTYQVNANLFGRGDWKDISNIRATFDFATGEVSAEIEKNEQLKLAITT